jgi:sulfite exporter TauE/SafE
MCSGLAGGLFAGAGRLRASELLLYHGTRILTYAALGVAGAALGQVLVMTGTFGKVQGVLMIGAGLLILAIGVRMLVPRRGAVPLAAPRVGQPMSVGQTTSVMVAAPEPPLPNPPPQGGRGPEPQRLSGGPFGGLWAPAAGLLNGLVPCSLVFSVALKAAATADPLRAGLLMGAFGLGTLPAMAAVSLAGGAVGARARGVLARLAAAAVIALGAWTLYEGVTFFHIMRGLASG